MRLPYDDDPNNLGMLLWKEDALQDVMARAHRAGWQIAAHALGDRAVEKVLAAYERIFASQPHEGSRHRIEHCMVVDDALARKMKRLGVVPVIQPDIHRLGSGYVQALGFERASQVIPMSIFARAGLSPAFSSDAPVIPCNPLEVIQSAARRTTPAGVTLGPEHRIGVLEGARRYTVHAAYATFGEKLKGKLAAGMQADFTVLSADPASTSPEELTSMRVLRTVVSGRTSFVA